MANEWKEVVADWSGDSVFIGINQIGGKVQIGSLPDKPGISPMEMLLLGVAGCTGIDVVNILSKKHQDLQNLHIHVRGKRAEKHPKVYTDIEIVYHLWGVGLLPRDVEQAITLSEEKYCSASATMKGVAKISWKYFIHKPGDLVE